MKIHAPIPKPIAMKIPCGEIATEAPIRNRSITGHVTEATTAEANGASLCSSLPAMRYPTAGHQRAMARPSNSPLATSLG